MKKLDKEILALVEKYGNNTRQALKENKKLPYLYALAKLRENVLEWYDFRKEGNLLQIGADYGALTGLFLKRVSEVTVLDDSEDSLEIVKRRYQAVPGADKLICLCGTASELTDGEKEKKLYDYIACIGTLRTGETVESQLEAAKALLAPGGVLLLAVGNRFGLKYFAGAEREGVSMTRRELEALLPGGRFYYPVPDYRIATEIYSDDYLPKKGDLTGILPVYDFPRYTSMEMGSAYDAVCEDGQFQQFSNSFLVIWKKGE
ncbi:MAG: methyltransferase domain-containing protein [Clostridium sp.]|nr:methyltransferase domain-containing protein [Clostridium sp.]MDY5483665.1 methyltransferase domain-containing protein [Clostridium sp.]